MTVSLTIPPFQLLIGAFDATAVVSSLEIERPIAERNTPQDWSGEFSFSLNGILDRTQYDELLYPERWGRGQQEVKIYYHSILTFTGRIAYYRYNKKNKSAEGILVDQIGFQNFERSPAIEIPVTVAIADSAANDRYKNQLRRQSVVTNIIASPFPPVQVTGGLTISLPAPVSAPAPEPEIFVFNGTAVDEIVYDLVLASGKINGTQVFSNVAEPPTLTGDITTPVVSVNPIQDAQNLAGTDRIWMYTTAAGQIAWKEYPRTGGTPIFQLTIDDVASIEPDFTNRERAFEKVVVKGQSELLTSNPEYKPERTLQTIQQGGTSTSGGGLTIAVGSVSEQTLPAVNSPYLPQQIPVSGSASFIIQGLTPYLPTTKTIEAGYLYNKAQAELLAQWYGDRLIQQAASVLVEMPITTAFLSNLAPFQVCHIGDKAMIIDAPRIVIKPTKAFITFTGCVIGTVETITDPEAPPSIPVPIVTTVSNLFPPEIEYSDFRAIETSESNQFEAEIEYDSPPLVSGYRQWHRSEEEITFTFDPDIAIWGDLSASNNDFVAVLSREPDIEVISRLNGRQVITFLEVTDTFVLNGSRVRNPCTIYLVIRGQTWTGERRILGAGIGDLELILDGTDLTVSTADGSAIAGTLADNTWALVTIVADGSNSALKIGATEVTGTLGSFDTDILLLGAAAGFRIAEFIRYPTAHSASDRAINEDYFEYRYNLEDRAADADVTGTPEPIVPDPAFDYSGNYTNPNITLSSGGAILNISNGSGGFILNGLNASSQNFVASSPININSSGSNHTFSISNASNSSNGSLLSTDWANFYDGYINASNALTLAASANSSANSAYTLAAAVNSTANSAYSLATSKQNQINGTGFVYANGTTLSYNSSIFLTALRIEDEGVLVGNATTINFSNVSSSFVGNTANITPISSGSEFTTTTVKTANYTAVSGDRIPCDTITIAAFSVTLPSSGIVAIFDKVGNTPLTGFGLNNLTVLPASGTIMGSTSLLLDVGATSVELERIGTDWRIRNGR